jgi:serine/threonine protein kinase/tetratricopeptide (TPR) repeat protein
MQWERTQRDAMECVEGIIVEFLWFFYNEAVFSEGVSMPFIAGENVGSYRVIEKLGQGGMATVFKAYHPALDRFVAIKVLHPAFKEDPHFIERFKREARVVAKLEHPNIVPVYDFAEHEGQPYLVMKYIEGETLKARLQRSPLLKNEAFKTIRAVGAALNYAHGKGVLHRDVKPSNIMLAADGEVFLTDFGLARMAEAGASTLTGDMLMGTPQYISPEQARGEKNLTACTDIYSFGIVLYEIVVGRVPYNADTPFSIIHDHIYSPLPLPSDVNPKVTQRIEQVLLKALAKNPEDRFKSGNELVDAFFNAVDKKDEKVVVPVVMDDTKSIEAENGERVIEHENAAFNSPVAPPSAVAPPSTDVSIQEKSKHLVQESKKKWLWIGAGLLMTLMVLIAFIAIANRPGIRTLFNQNNAVATDMGMPTEAKIEARTEVNTPSRIEEAEKIVAERPDDPDAHLQLAEAYHAEGMIQKAVDQYLEAGSILMDQKRFEDSVNALNEAIVLQGGLKDADRGTLENVEKKLFLSASDNGMVPMYQSMANRYPNWDMLKVCEARSYIYLGQMDRAEFILDEILSNSPDNLLANAVGAELAFLKGMNEEALSQILTLLNKPNLPEWLREHLQKLEREIRNKMERNDDSSSSSSWQLEDEYEQPGSTGIDRYYATWIG